MKIRPILDGRQAAKTGSVLDEKVDQYFNDFDMLFIRDVF